MIKRKYFSQYLEARMTIFNQCPSDFSFGIEWYLLMMETPHNLLQKSTPLYTDPVLRDKNQMLPQESSNMKKSILFCEDYKNES